MLELKDICYEVYDEVLDGDKEILNHVNLTVKDNDFMVITGPNGGGKSTIAKMIMGIIQPTKGKILFNGEDITNLSITERAKLGIGFAFQQPVRFKGLFVFDLLKFAAGRELSVDEACVYLSEVGLCAKDYVDREVNGSLSGGELKRIEIAMLMARKSSLSVFDEPEAGIDLWSFKNLVEVFQNLRKETSGSILIISHQERILEIADTIAIISNGEIREVGSRDEMLPKLMEDSMECTCLKRRGEKHE
ncbi:Fe-S cluster assembly ATP-binding protein [Aequitasia blattaphilus]|uniref:ATP-binding cassette domain-containing protein n=1 Tax=Aequitasia blattaphilus TaxID=2949332 RepID=A0ABT1ED02_9FIRM|nr:ATP-binding cassette domain-containing protein [Aequitasia blattaphilus]MCP1103705.1 ATP-binding cassette domain-containing protein [Aequitasia blattaphilus]MCR8616345.1 ATP-binding cassette domain-containing protein [Aequitasia blattaphilus]